MTRDEPVRSTLTVAAALAMVAAVSLGLARFSYALLLPPMRADLHWSYLTAGAMNTVNAAGYLLGALLLPRVLARVDVRTVLLAGSAGAALLLIGHGVVSGDAALFALRLLTGVASAAAFVGGGVLAARLATTGVGRAASSASATSTKPRPRSSDVMNAGHCCSRSAKSTMLATPTESGKAANIGSSLVESPT